MKEDSFKFNFKFDLGRSNLNDVFISKIEDKKLNFDKLKEYINKIRIYKE